jgi:hypothetical protein
MRNKKRKDPPYLDFRLQDTQAGYNGICGESAYYQIKNTKQIRKYLFVLYFIYWIFKLAGWYNSARVLDFSRNYLYLSNAAFPVFLMAVPSFPIPSAIQV